jgi:putative phosphoribosyl transferase
MFKDRSDAGKKLAAALEEFRSVRPLVLGIPRGGAEVGCEVAKYLQAEFSLIIARKLPIPGNPEAGFGAIAEDGTLFLIEKARQWLSESEIDRVIKEQKLQLSMRLAVLRKGKPLPEIKGRTVILVDDGIAMGSTIRACIRMCRNRQASLVIVAAPVSGVDTAELIAAEADRAVILETPADFQAVAQSYRKWSDLSDEQVLQLLKNMP